MTRLLVSVRDAQEAEIALASGVDLIDVKEPSRGSLGAADAATLAAIARCVDGRAPLSAALGELFEARSTATLPAAFRFAKFGLAGCRARPDWIDRWRTALAELPPGAAGVAVVYADWRQRGRPRRGW